MGRLAHELPLPHGRRSVAADVPARLAQRLLRSRPNDHEQWRLCGRRATKRSDWRGGRAADRWLCSGAAAACTSLHPASSGPAPGLAGDRGGDLTGAAPSAATCKPVSSPSGPRSRTREGTRARDPRARERAAACLSRHRRPGWIRVRDGSPSRGETPVPRRLDAQRNGPAPRSGDTPRPTGT